MSETACILIVDDQREIRESLSFALRDRHAVVTACGAEDAFRHLADYKVDLVLLDYKMPGIDGITALREIKRRHPDTEVIMMTGYAPVDTRKKALELGVFAFFMKPFDIDKLVGTINEALKKRRSGLPVRNDR